MTPTRDACTLVSASCTTGWADWIHGELWVCSAGLLRRPLGLGATISHGGGPTIDVSRRPVRDIADLRIAGVGRDRWIAWEDVRRADLRAGPMTHSLHLELGDNRKAKFLWMGSDRATEYFETTLPGVLGDRFVD